MSGRVEGNTRHVEESQVGSGDERKDRLKEMAEEDKEVFLEDMETNSGARPPQTDPGRCGDPGEETRIALGRPLLRREQESEKTIAKLNGRRAYKAPPSTAPQVIREQWNGVTRDRNLAFQTWAYTESIARSYGGDSCMTLSCRCSVYPTISYASPLTSLFPIPRS